MKLDFTSLFCQIDDFFQGFDLTPNQKLLSDGRKTRKRSSGLSHSEMATIVIAYHQVRFRDFKTFYLSCFSALKKLFPGLLSYNRFVQLMPRITLPLMAFALSLRGECTGISFVDSTPLEVCRPKRIYRHRVFRDLAKRGRSTKGWFFGFKLHLVINECGELLSFHLTSGNVDDRKPVPSMAQGLWGKLYADKGYISKKLVEELAENGLRLITAVRDNMKNRLLCLEDKLLLRKRSVIETVNDQLKNISEIEHSRHRSPANFLINLLSGLIAYMLKPAKPTISGFHNPSALTFA